MTLTSSTSILFTATATALRRGRLLFISVLLISFGSILIIGGIFSSTVLTGFGGLITTSGICLLIYSLSLTTANQANVLGQPVIGQMTQIPTYTLAGHGNPNFQNYGQTAIYNCPTVSDNSTPYPVSSTDASPIPSSLQTPCPTYTNVPPSSNLFTTQTQAPPSYEAATSALNNKE